MKVTNALIDKCSELWLAAALEHGFGSSGFALMRGMFLSDYLRATSIKDAKANFDFDAWQDAYSRFHKWLYGALPPGEGN